MRFLRRRGLVGGKAGVGRRSSNRVSGPLGSPPLNNVLTPSVSGPVWTSAGPVGVNSITYGLVSGRVASIAFDPSDTTGNHVFLGTTGGGLWKSQNAAASVPGSVQFLPLTDGIATLSGVAQAGISVGAVSVQPGGTGVVLAGLGDPNDALDSYYGAGLLRSADGGATWTLIQHTVDLETLAGLQDYWFVGEGFAGFAWSNTNVQTVVAAVSQAYDGVVVNAGETAQSYEGLYYSADGGVTWHLSRITDLNGQDIQGPLDGFALPDGNAATSVVWNPVRQMFIAAVRYHGYYQSPDGVTFTQMAAQPGTGFTTGNCPTDSGSVGVAGCPIFRGSLAVNPLTGDTFAWSVDAFNQDQGIWQDLCAISFSGSTGVCTNQAISFGVQLSTTALEISDENGAATIANGDYNLTLAAVPSQLSQGADTLLFAGDNDLWKCSVANSCQWRNTTNATTCASASVGEYQHAVAWDTGNPLLMFTGNDSGIWRSTDQVGETGSVCSGTDASHFQNLNGSVGSLAEVESLAQSKSTAATMLVGLGTNGFAGIVNASSNPGPWNEVLSGEGGPVVVNSASGLNDWYANNGAGVSIFHCASTTACTPAGFGTTAIVGEKQVQNDGLTMPYPAAFKLDALDPTQMLLGTCRVWRGPVSGTGWNAANAISPPLDGTGGTVGNACDGNGLIRTIALGAASATSGSAGGEVIYVGMAGAADGGGLVAGHVFTARLTNGVVGAWTDLTYSPVINNQLAFNAFGEDVSSLYVDPHDATGGTVYATISGFSNVTQPEQQVYRTIDGGAHWASITANLTNAPANALVVDTQDPNTVYIASDTGVSMTRAVATCASSSGGGVCWAPYGTGLPESPVTTLVVTPPGAAGPYSGQALTAGTYGRGIWQIPMVTAGTTLTTAGYSPGSLTFGSVTVGASSTAQNITLKNTGTPALKVTGIVFTGLASADFQETDGCVGVALASGASCVIKVTFAPAATGSRVAAMAVSMNISGGELLFPMTGTGLATANITLLPTSLAFGTVQVGTSSTAQAFNVQNIGGSTVSISSIVVSAPFARGTTTCSTTLAANTACAVNVVFTPTTSGAATGTFTIVDGVGTQSAQLSGTGITPPTDTLSTTAISFPNTVLGQTATPIPVTITNSGGLPLTSIGTSITVTTGVSGDFTVVNNCGSQLAANSSCGLSVGFAPTVALAEYGTLVISDSLHARTVALAGKGLRPPVIALSPAMTNFGSVQVNTSSAARTVTISNTGGSPLALPSFSLSGVGAANFSVTNSTGATACGTTVAAASSCALQVVFTPQLIGATTATLTVTTSSPGVIAASVTLNGVGLTPPMLGVAPLSLDFGPVSLDNSSALFTVQVTNTGQVAMTLPTFAVSGAQANDFALSAPLDIAACTTLLNPGAQCNIQVTFSPTIVGLETATLTVTGANAVPMTSTVSLMGTGLAVILLNANPAQLTYPATPVGLTSTVLTVAVSNLGKKTANNLTFTLSGAYQLAPASTTCGASLAGARFCVVGVIFSPTAAGDQPGTLTVQVSNLGVSPLVVPLDGIGIAVGGILPSPTQMTFGSAVVNTTSVAQTLTVTNSGQAAVTGLNIAIGGSFQLTGNQCTGVLAAPVCAGGTCTAASCTTGVVFTPLTTGNQTGTITVSSTATGVLPAVVSLTGNGTPPGSLTANPAVVSFGAVTIGQTSATQTVVITNASGTAAMTLNGVALKVTGDFSVVQSTCGTQIPPGAGCIFSVTFTPVMTGSRIGSVSVTSTTPGYTPVVVGLAGTGLPSAQLVVTPGTLAFGTVQVGTNSTAQLLTVMNPGTGSLNGLSFKASAPFSVGSGSCASTLPAGATCTVPVEFTPTAAGTLSGLITIGSTSLGVTAVEEPVSGTGILPPILTLSPRTLTFAASPLGMLSAAQKITVTNTGGSSLAGLALTVTGSAAEDFLVTASSCPGSLTRGYQCAVLIAFRPTGAGGRTAFLTASSTTSGVTSESTSLSGVGLAPGQLVTAPASVAFPATLIGQQSASVKIGVVNSGQTDITDLVLNATQGFVLDKAASSCTATLAAGAKCFEAVAFAPTTSGEVDGSLIASSAIALKQGSVAASTALTGKGALAPGIATTPAALVLFPITGVKTSASPIAVTITNQGGLAALSGLSIAINAAGKAAGFALGNTNCSTTITPGASCVVYVTFTPTAAGNLSGALLVKSSGLTTSTNSSVSLSLSGIGFDFTMALVGAGSVSVVQGQTAYYMIAVTPLAGTTGALGDAFNLSCSNLPTNALCLFNPPQLPALPANVSGDVTLGIGSGGPITIADRVDRGLIQRDNLTRFGKPSDSLARPALAGTGLLLCGAVTFPLAWWRRRVLKKLSRFSNRRGSSSRSIHVVLLGLLLVGLVSGLTSCTHASGSGGQLHGTGGTAAGTYTVVVTAASTGVVHQLSVKLVVN